MIKQVSLLTYSVNFIYRVITHIRKFFVTQVNNVCYCIQMFVNNLCFDFMNVLSFSLDLMFDEIYEFEYLIIPEQRD